MKLGLRLALITTLLMAGVLALVTWAMMRLRRADLESDVQREALVLADSLAAGIEPVSPLDAPDALEKRVAWASAKRGSFLLETLVAGLYRTPNFNSWAGLVEAATTSDKAVGRLVEGNDRSPFFAVAVPLHNAAPDDPARQAVAFLGIIRDASYIDREVVATTRRALPFLAAGVLAFGAVVYFLLFGSVVTPLRRLVDAIDAVSKGDLSRALLPERDDEIGTLAGRFNAMTNYLREAREEQSRANAARLALETRLRHAEKLATMGQMAAEIAHEVGTPLNVIGGRARSIARRPADTGDVQKNADIIAGQVDRIAKIIRQVLDFSRKNRPAPSQARVDVGKVVAEALEFVSASIARQGIQTDVRAAPDLPGIPGDPDEIQQVCLNLIGNAVHAMPGGGSLRVTLDHVTRRKEGLALAPPAPFLLLEVSDSGAGIPVADREKIFEAFFTTKDTGEGTGLGLAVAKGIVKDHDGWIEVDDRPGGGASFRVFLPTGAEAVSDDTGAGLALPKHRGSARIK